MEKSGSLSSMRHSLAHLLAAAVLDLYPKTLNTIGPAIDDGFYYDFEFASPISDKDLPKIEKKMRELLKNWEEFSHKEVSRDEARDYFKYNPYKLELIDEIVEKGEKITLYTSGGFTDLCRGGHLDNPAKEILPDSFRLDRVAGAYWRGDEKNKMLTRIYGLAFESKEKLEEYLANKEEAAKRDHRKLGKALDLFCFSDLVGPGLPIFTPKGTIIIEELQKHVEKVCRRYGFEKVMAPHLAKIELFETSGHAKKFNEELFRVSSLKGHEFVLKPVQCPHHTQIYASKPRSYKDLPIRYMESNKQYRAEKTGEVGGLSRVYAITVEDGHTFCRIDQVKDEIKSLVNIIKDFYTALGLWGHHWVSLSVRDYGHPEKYIGDTADWDLCEQMLQEVSDELGLEAKKMEGEAALYGPKLDFMFRDSMGKEIQIPTVQVDFATPKRFGLVYTDKDGSEKNPVMVHRAILGSYERFLALIIEHFAGAFPLWLSPVQVKILPISQEKHLDYAKEVFDKLKENDIRVELDESSETLGKKIRSAKTEKVPYIIVIGDKEKDSKTLTVEGRGGEKLENISATEFLAKLKEDIANKS